MLVRGAPQTLQGLCTVAWQTLEQYGTCGWDGSVQTGPGPIGFWQRLHLKHLACHLHKYTDWLSKKIL